MRKRAWLTIRGGDASVIAPIRREHDGIFRLRAARIESTLGLYAPRDAVWRSRCRLHDDDISSDAAVSAGRCQPAKLNIS